MDLFLIRHGQSMNNANLLCHRVEDPGLTELGQEQAARLGQWLQPVRLTRLITSPFRRTLETTRLIQKSTGLRPEVWIDLHEQGGCISGVDLDSYTGCPGLTRAEIRAEFPGYQLPPEIDEHGWWKSRPFEPKQKAQQRAERVIQKTTEVFANSQERIAFVSHGGFLLILIGVFLGLPVIDRDRLGAIPNTAVTRLQISPDQVRLVFYNMLCHLPTNLIT